MRYLYARVEEQARERGYRNYVTDVLKGLTGAEQRYADMFGAVETRTADEIKDSIKKKLRDANGNGLI